MTMTEKRQRAPMIRWSGEEHEAFAAKVAHQLAEAGYTEVPDQARLLHVAHVLMPLTDRPRKIQSLTREKWFQSLPAAFEDRLTRPSLPLSPDIPIRATNFPEGNSVAERLERIEKALQSVLNPLPTEPVLRPIDPPETPPQTSQPPSVAILGLDRGRQKGHILDRIAQTGTNVQATCYDARSTRVAQLSRYDLIVVMSFLPKPLRRAVMGAYPDKCVLCTGVEDAVSAVRNHRFS